MKKVLPILLLAVAGHSHAQQLEAGQKILSGSFSFSNSKNDNYYNAPVKQSNVIFNPSLAFVKNKNTIYGAFISFGHTGIKIPSNPPEYGEVKGNDYNAGVGLFVQKMKWLNDKWFLYAEGGIQGGIGTHKVIDKTDNSKLSKSNSWNTGIYIAPGVSYRISQKFLVDFRFNNLLTASFNKVIAKQNTLPIQNYSNSENFYVSTSLNNNALSNIGIGFRWLIN